MRFTSIRKLTLAALSFTLPLAAQINPVNQIAWPTCSSTQPYVPSSNTCESVVTSIAGASGSFTFNGIGVSCSSTTCSFNPPGVVPVTVSALPSASSATNDVYWVKDGSTSSDCTTGGGSHLVECQSNGTSWAAAVGAGGVSGSGTTGYIPWWASATSLGNSHMDDGVTLASWFTLTENEQLTNSGDSTQIDLFPTTHAPATATGAASIAPPATVTTSNVSVLPQAPYTGITYKTNSGGVMQESGIGCSSTAGNVLTDNGSGAPSCQALPTGSSSQAGILKCGSGITCSGGTASVSSSGSNYMTNITGTVTSSGCTMNGAGTACVVGSSTGTVSFSSIPSTYTNLRIVVTGMQSASGDSTWQVNSDSTSGDYDYHFQLGGTGNDTTGSSNHGCYFSSTTYPTNCTFEFLDYSGTTFKKVWRSIDNNNDRTDDLIFGGYWNQTSAIASFALSAAGSDTFDVGTTFQVWAY